MRKELMERIVDKNAAQGGEVWCISKHLLAASMRLYEVGTKALGAGNKKDAYAMFERAYELYSLFWGGLIGEIGTAVIGAIAVLWFAGVLKGK